MLRKEDLMVIQALAKRGVYQKDIARARGAPEDGEPGLKRGGAPSAEAPGARKSKLDPYKAMVDGLLAEGVWNAVVILGSSRRAATQGSITILQRLHPAEAGAARGRATVRFETRAGPSAAERLGRDGDGGRGETDEGLTSR